MTLRCVVALAAGLAFTGVGSALAQVPLMGGNRPTFDSAPPAPPPGAAGPGGMMQGPPPGAAQGGMAPQGGGQEPPCFKDFVPLREAAEKRANLIKSAAERKAPRPEVCQLFKNFAVAEAKVVKFVADNQSQCQIPAQAVTQMKANHDRTMKTRDQVCAAGPMGAAPAPGAPPPGPRLSDELGVRGVAGPSNVTPGRGTFDTLQGSALSR